MTARFSIRRQLLIPSCLLLIYPIGGYLGINHWVKLLEQGQRESLLHSAQGIARILEQSPDLMNHVPAIKPLEPGHDLYSRRLTGTMVLDGRKQDWESIATSAEHYDKTNLVSINFPYTVDSLSYELLIGSDKEHLYLFLEVKDDFVIYREINNLSVHRNDHVQIGFLDAQSVHRRYTFASHQPALVTAHVVSEGGRSLRPEPRISGAWLGTATGYNLEIMIPLSMLGKTLAVAVADVDDPDRREIKFIMGSADPTIADDLGALLIPSAQLGNLMAGLSRARVSLLDTHQRLISATGTIDEVDEPRLGHNLAWFDRLTPVENQADAVSYIENALAGRPTHGAIGSGVSKVLIATSPVFHDGKIVAAVSHEQANQEIVSIRDEALLSLMWQSSILITAGIVCWLFFSFRITSRLARLKTELEAAVDSQGRLNQLVTATGEQDEIGDLRLSFVDVASRLQQYNHYLEAMAGRLAHELRTPVSIVRSSLENLDQTEIQPNNSVYIQRAHEGVQRLTTILNNMSEATRLEQSLDDAEIESFDLAQLVRGCANGYRQAFPDQTFSVSIEAETVMLTGIPDLLAQLLDKLVNNAIEFSEPDNPIKLRLTTEKDTALLRVINDGPGLPVEMRDKLFDSMISVRHTYSGSHLGLGLYIARIIADFHGGTISAADRQDTRGVIVTLQIPMMRLTASR